MIVESQAEKKAEAIGDASSGLLTGDSLTTLSKEALRDKVELLQEQAKYCGQGTKGMFDTATEWCTSDTFALLNLVFLLIYVLDVVFKVGVNVKKQAK